MTTTTTDHESKMVEGNEDIDATFKGLMEDTFGPSGEASDDRIQRGISHANALSEVSAANVEWLCEVSHSLIPDRMEQPRLCFKCGKPEPGSTCGQCGVARYCDRQCQIADWSAKKGAWGGHKTHCGGYKALGMNQELAVSRQHEVVETLLAKARLYLCPFALCHGSGGGKGKPRGLAFLQVGCSLATLALPAPRDCSGKLLNADERTILVHFVSVEEFEAEVAATDPRISELRQSVSSAVASHDDREQIVVLVRASCGFTALLKQPIVPAWNVTCALAQEYTEQECLQINLDDI